MGVVMDISHRVMVLDFGRKIAEGDPAAVLADPHVKRAYLGEEDEVLVDPDDTASTADLKSLHHKPRVLSGTSDR
jgi:branched-chain amino acid transport system ATP-binding protein